MPKGVYLRKTRNRGVSVEWRDQPGFKPFGDRLDFLSPERQHLAAGRLAILPAKERHGKRS